MNSFTSKIKWAILLAILAFVYVGCGGGGDGGVANGGAVGGGGGNGQAPVAKTTFNMVALAGFGGTFSAGLAINDSGLAVGFADDGTGVKGARWTVTDPAPTAVALSPLSGNHYSAAYGINADGVAVGESGATIETAVDAVTVAVFWPAGETVPTALNVTGVLAGGASAAFAINRAGEVVGEGVIDADGNTAALYWADSTAAPVILGNLPGGTFSSAYFVGADGRIVGEAQDGAGQTQAVVWMPAVGVGFQAPVALAAVTGQIGSIAYGVDPAGRIVGEAELASGEVQGVIWSADGSAASTLGAETSAQAINADNRIVGYSMALTGVDRAIVWNADNIGDSRSLAAAFSQAYGINAATQIVGVSGHQAFVALPQ